MNDIGMDLAEPTKRHVIGGEGGLEAAPVFENTFLRVPLSETKIQDFFTAKIAHAAGTRAEPMDQPRDFGQPSRLKHAQATLSALHPGIGYRVARHPPAVRAASSLGAVGWHRGTTSIIGAGRSALKGVEPGRVRAVGGLLIIGMGVDIAEVDRIRKAIERHGETFLRRLYTEKERDYCEQFKNKYERYAGRFAAKEAGMKALGTGWRRGVRWVDLEVVREKSGRPTLKLAGEAEKIAGQIGVKRIALSITHTEEQALAQVIFEG